MKLIFRKKNFKGYYMSHCLNTFLDKLGMNG